MFRSLSTRGLHVSAAREMQIKAAVARSPTAPFTVEQLMLRAPRADEVIVKLVATGLCHTDVAVKTRNLCAFPIVLGHEGAGVIEQVGPAVKGLKVGDNVLMSYASCGTCPTCRVGKPAYCFDHGSLNFAGTHPDGSTSHSEVHGSGKIFGSFFQQSSFASHALCTANNLLKVDKDANLPELAPLGCGVQTGAGAVFNTLGAKAGESIAVFGGGAVGLSAIMAAAVVKCKHIIAIDMNPARLKLAKELGATHLLQVTGKEEKGEVVALIQAIVSGPGVNYAIDTTGNNQVLRSAFDSLQPLGVCGMIGGSAAGTEVKIDMLSLLPGKQLRGVIQGDSIPHLFIPTLMQLHKDGHFPYHKLITYYKNGLADINKAVEESCGPSATAIKPVIIF